jgi:hypothetical protein
VAPLGERTFGAALLLSAVRALKHDGDAKRALALARSYEQRFPGGTLAEEALAVQLQAMVVLEDPLAQESAADYLRRFPSGRFAPYAARVIEGEQGGAP